MKSNDFTFLQVSLNKLSNSKNLHYSNHSPRMEFHISRTARDKYQFDEAIFQKDGNAIVANFRAARAFAQKMNEQRDLTKFPELAVKAGQINAMGLIDEILHHVVQLYREEINPEIFTDAGQYLTSEFSTKLLDKLLLEFNTEFPALAVYQNQQTAEEYLEANAENKSASLEELLLLWISNQNPALAKFKELFDDSNLADQTSYSEKMESLYEFFDKQPKFGPEKLNLIDLLMEPAQKFPDSLTAQLGFMREKWGLLLGKFFYRLLSSLDFIKEEEKAIFIGPGPTQELKFGVGISEAGADQEPEPEQFSPDRHWMPRLVLLAKSTYVWLDQLSKKYERDIHHLDQIPDEELDRLAQWGFTGLWLIGLWERSKASQKIKQLCGNPEAVASAYSLYDYEIAHDLGGENAYQNLKDRAWQRGIRMCGDMVPNHMGIDSRWVNEHPDWFIGLDYPPFPAYTYNGPNVSQNDRVGIFLEDHYFERSDAAVTFKRVDFHTGDTKYIYHGNDGTSMPWNDTAQLDYLKPEVREAVIQTIIAVARRFPVIRFDAAMTLAKKHFHRLWFPEPGSGGDIASRSEFGLTKEQFDQAVPVEFWREVVDRIAQEVPDTLLLAEAFWLMEGYFVRTLGMHRVYNSAFMNMLKAEENAKYRSSIKNVLEFNPEILKRFVNFMNNPDEDTAIAQFGREDKYFGVCILMIAMPGLPMFGHGQVEGFTEKYGMEYRKAYWNEIPDEDLIKRHEAEVFPVMHKRYLFAEVENFLLYDFFAPEGHVNENVFAISNRTAEERGLVVFNNKFDHARGWIKTSVPFVTKTGSDESVTITKNLGEGLNLSYDENSFVIFRDQITGLEYIRNSKELFEQGLYVELHAFKYQVFLDFHEVRDNQWHHYRHVCNYLDGSGVPSINDALRETFLKPIHQSFRELTKILLPESDISITKKEIEELTSLLLEKQSAFLQEIYLFSNGTGTPSDVLAELKKELRFLNAGTDGHKQFNLGRKRKSKKVLADFAELFSTEAEHRLVIKLIWALHRMGEVVDKGPEATGEIGRSGFDEWMLNKEIRSISETLTPIKMDTGALLQLLKVVIDFSNWSDKKMSKSSAFDLITAIIHDPDGQQLLNINRYDNILWYNREALELLVTHLKTVAVLNSIRVADDENVSKQLELIDDVCKLILQAAKKSEYKVEQLLKLLKPVKTGKAGK